MALQEPLRYEFTNFSSDHFTGRFGGINYEFEPGETRSFDPDKHYMLLILAKQLADNELIKQIKGVGRDQKDSDTWGKSLDKDGRPFMITVPARKDLMRKAIGALTDTPIPVPEDKVQEAGATKEASEDIRQLKQELQDMKELLASFGTSIHNDAAQAAGKKPLEVTEQPMARETLETLAKEQGIEDVESKSKVELQEEINENR